MDQSLRSWWLCGHHPGFVRLVRLPLRLAVVGKPNGRTRRESDFWLFGRGVVSFLRMKSVVVWRRFVAEWLGYGSLVCGL